MLKVRQYKGLVGLKCSAFVNKSSQQGAETGKAKQNRPINIPSRELTYPLDKAYLKMIFLFPRWDMLVPWRVCISICPILGANFIVIELRIFCLSSNAQLCSSFVSRVHKTGPTSSYSIPIPATRCLTVFRLIILSYEIHSVF